MKTLLLLRHGKAQADSHNGDKDRALTERGERDASAMGRLIKGLVGCPDLVVTSDARRARKTAKLAAEATGCREKPTLKEAIYDADPETLLAVVQALPERADSVLLVGHNPGFQEMGAALAEGGEAITHLPTAGLIHLEFDADEWQDVQPGAGRLRGLHTPQD